MENISEIEIIVVKSGGIKPGTTRDCTPLRLSKLKSRTIIHVSDEWMPLKLINFIDNTLKLPAVDEYDEKLAYVLKRDAIWSIELVAADTLRKSGIKEGDVLKIIQVPAAYGYDGDPETDELELGETTSMVRYEDAEHPPPEILEPFNKINKVERGILDDITDYIAGEKTGGDEEVEEGNEK